MIIARCNVGGEWPKRIEGRLAAFLQLFVHIHLDLVHRHMARAFNHHLTAACMGDLGQLAQSLQLGKLSRIIGIRNGARTQAVAKTERDIIGPHNVANVGKMGIEEALFMMRQAPFRHDRPAARDNAGDALRGQVDIGQTHAGMDGEIVDTLLALLDQRVAVNLPGQIFGNAIHFFQRLVDWHRADRHRAVADDPFARVVDVATGRQVHDIVRAPAGRPDHFLDLFFNR